jgi:hypothetical protein
MIRFSKNKAQVLIKDEKKTIWPPKKQAITATPKDPLLRNGQLKLYPPRILTI